MEDVPARLSGDPGLGPFIERVGPPRLDRTEFDTAYLPLVRSIVYQQLSGKAASTIFGRFATAFGDGEMPAARRVAKASIEDLRAVGLSKSKATYIQGLAQAEVAGDMPDRRAMESVEDEEVIAQLTAFRGVGRWTAQMFLMFWLGRPDIFPVDDLGIRKGIALIDDLVDMPSVDYANGRAAAWRPHRTLACWYLWRSLDLVPPTD